MFLADFILIFKGKIVDIEFSKPFGVKVYFMSKTTSLYRAMCKWHIIKINGENKSFCFELKGQ